MFDESDRRAIEAHGLTLEEAERQLRLLREPPPPTCLDRPCTPGDGIRRLDDDAQIALAAGGEDVASAGRVGKFVPASGAATRMFKRLLAARDRGLDGVDEARRLATGDDPDAAAFVRLWTERDRLPIRREMSAVLRSVGLDPDALTDAHAGEYLRLLLSRDGFDAASRPKGLLSFHDYGDAVRTAFEEQLWEAVGYARDRAGRCRLHVTVSPEHEHAFRRTFESVAPRLRDAVDTGFDVTFSHQSSSTDTIAVDGTGAIVREVDGSPHFRPGGHGALLSNLERTGGDVVVVKNIDNILPDDRKPLVTHWKRVLIGLAARLEADVNRCLADLEAGAEGAIDRASALLRDELARGDDVAPGVLPADPAAARRALIDELDRPIRVAGVVRNDGEPGGGPFWVREPDGRCTLQIVETSQVDRTDPDQDAIVRAATHFNPVDLVCVLRARDGRPRRLDAFVEPRAVFVSTKSHGGRDLVALERPGLWNGSMARWNTVFVEVPIETFAPVKTILDLLRPEHQPRRRSP